MDIKSLLKFTMFSYDCGLFVKEYIAKYKYKKWNRLTYKNSELKNYRKSDICYICGNGPSLNKVNLDELKGDLIVMNDHWRLAPKYKKAPTYYIINDNAYGLIELKDRMQGVLDCFPDIPHVFSTYLGPSMDCRFKNSITNIFYYNNIGRTFKHTYTIDFTKCTYYTWNVVTAAIQLAIYVGYKEIYLLGCDYSLFASRYLEHAYDKEGVKVECPEKLRDMLFKYTITTHIHYEMAQYAKNHDVKIINLTSASLLDAYEMDPDSKY